MIERSLDGFALIAGADKALREGLRIRPATPATGERFGFRSGRITRTQPALDGSMLVFVEIES